MCKIRDGHSDVCFEFDLALDHRAFSQISTWVRSSGHLGAR
jgi:hypothetical protein